MSEIDTITGFVAGDFSWESALDFDIDSVSRALGEPVDADQPTAREQAGEALRHVFEFIVEGVSLECPNLPKVGRRLLVLLWVMRPELFGGCSIRELSARLGMHPSKIYPVTAAVTRVLGISNHGQDHGSWSRKEEK